MEQSLSTVTVEECVTQNVYGGGARNRKWLRWWIVRLWWLANDPLLQPSNDLSGDELMEATVAECASVWLRRVFTVGRKVPADTLTLQR
jgi:hypothetical protein